MAGGVPMGGQPEANELSKLDLMELYQQRCQMMGVAPNRCFVRYLEETQDENESLELVVQGNDKLNFNSRLTDEGLIALASALEPYAAYIEDIDLRFNELTDVGAKALGDLVGRSNRLLGLNVQGNKIKSEGAQYLAESLRECTGL